MRQTQTPMALYRHQITLNNTDIDLSQANTTQQNIQVYTVPEYSQILSMEIMNTGPSVTGTGLISFTASLGSSSGGSDLIQPVDLQTSGNSAVCNAPVGVQTTDTKIYLGLVPLGANFSALNTTMTFRVSLLLASPA